MAKSLFEKKNIKKISEEEIRLYEAASSSVLNETLVLWQLSQVFLLGNTFLIGFIGIIFEKANDKIAIISLSIIGLSISILWFFSFVRISKYYEFKIAQAKQREPDGWMLLREDGENFSEGDSVKINDRKYSVGLSRLSNLTIVKFLIFIFVIFYLSIILLSSGIIKY